MIRKFIWITVIVLIVLSVGIYLFGWYTDQDCPPPRNPNKFAEPWLENKIPHGDLGRLAEKYANPILGNDTQSHGALVGGFFKGVNVYPSSAAAGYYQRYLSKYLKSSQALPYWHMQVGELLCKTQS